jgi:Domain of unknown function (DUF4232)
MKLFTRGPTGLVARAVSAVAAIAAIATVVVPAASGAASAAGTPACSTSGLVVWLDTNSSGALGSSFFNLMFTNESGHRCTLIGYPGVSAVNLHGQQIGAAAIHNAGIKKKTVTLNNGASAVANLRVAEAGNFPPSTCKPRASAGFRVFPPNQRAAKYVPFPFMTCAGKSDVTLSIRVVQKSRFTML